MAVLKCTVCGGELELNADCSVGVCQYCGSSITIPKELDRKGNLYNRAVFLRQNNEFDKAVLTYEDILKEDNADAEAHWGLVLSKFGIEYVADPKTNEYKPTCHRTQIEPILSDPDYLAAIQYSDSEAAAIIENEARKISVIQARIIEIIEKEPPYDIFICYKESDENGARTQDSILAQDLYYELQKRDYKVFFARKTLESKLGSEYEPIIFAALNSASVMIALGTTPENFNAVWVRNEWSRFLKMSKDKNKVLIPAYRGFSPYELPVELSNLQSQDMSKIGFMQDIIDGIERCLRRGKKTTQTPIVQAQFNAPVEPCDKLIKNGSVYIKLNNFTAATDVYERMTKNYPDEYMGWWGLVLCKTKNLTAAAEDKEQITTWYKYAKQLADEKRSEELEKEYLEYLELVSQVSMKQEYENVNKIIDEQTNYIKSLNKSIDMVKSSIASREKAYNYQEKVDTETIAAHTKTLNFHQSKLLKKQITTAVTWMSFLITIVCAGLFADSQEEVLIVLGSIFLLGAIVARAIMPKAKMSYYKKGINYARTNVENATKFMENNKTIYQNDISNFHKSIGNINRNISLTKARIDACNKYLSLGSEKIAEFCYCAESERIGVPATCDSYVQLCRDYAYGDKPVVIENEEETNDSASVEDIQQYEVACSCGRKFLINKQVLDSGSCICEVCGQKILFK